MPPQTRRLKVQATNSGAQISPVVPPQLHPERLKSTSPTKVKVSSTENVSPNKKTKTVVKKALSEPQPAPTRWKEVYDLIKQQRQTFVAPVDRMGCDQVAVMELESQPQQQYDEKGHQDLVEGLRDKALSERNRRFACLVSLMLSSQTKDEVTIEAISNLRKNLKDSLTLESLRSSSLDEIERCINKVGFWKKKAQFIKLMAEDLYFKHNSDVPKTLEELVALKGVGPKMAFLALSSAWSINLGIGVDTHVHRISNRLGWLKTSDAEATRVHLESWLPKELFNDINHLLVGFGQVICVPVGPKCEECFVGRVPGLCPSFKPGKKPKSNIQKRSSKEVTIKRTGPRSTARKSRKLDDELDMTLNVKPMAMNHESESLKSSRYFQNLPKIKKEQLEDVINAEDNLIRREHNAMNSADPPTVSESKIKIEIEEIAKKEESRNDNDSASTTTKHKAMNEDDRLLSSSPLTELDDNDNLLGTNFCSNQLLSW